MKDITFTRILIFIVVICVLLTAAHLIYAVYAYQQCSIIEFIAKELW